jgi:hypothetical protein
MLLV